jgi:hypothetical protein
VFAFPSGDDGLEASSDVGNPSSGDMVSLEDADNVGVDVSDVDSSENSNISVEMIDNSVELGAMVLLSEEVVGITDGRVSPPLSQVGGTSSSKLGSFALFEIEFLNPGSIDTNQTSLTVPFD